MGKPIFWVSLEEWSVMTPAEAQSLDDYCEERGMELGIDCAGWHTDDIRRQADYQKDAAEDRQTGGGPGA